MSEVLTCVILLGVNVSIQISPGIAIEVCD